MNLKTFFSRRKRVANGSTLHFPFGSVIPVGLKCDGEHFSSLSLWLVFEKKNNLEIFVIKSLQVEKAVFL